MSDNQQGLIPIAADIVFCIDGTGSMSKKTSSDTNNRLIDEVKEKAEKISEFFLEEASKNNYDIVSFRIKVIVFRDYETDAHLAMQESSFYSLPEKASDLASFVNGIDAAGGGDVPENSLEAISYAFKSDWTQEGGGSRRHITVLFTDAPPIPLGQRSFCPDYPKDLPKDLNALKDMWTCADQETKMSLKTRRLVLLAPSCPEWEEVACWEKTLAFPVNANEGLSGISIEDIMGYIVKSF